MPGLNPDLKRQYEFVLKRLVDWKYAKQAGSFYLDEFDEAVENLAYVIGFGQKNGFVLTAETIKGILIFILSQQTFFKMPDSDLFQRSAEMILSIGVGKTN